MKIKYSRQSLLLFKFILGILIILVVIVYELILDILQLH